jgi:glucose/mannose transport system substrate-binding protein
MRLIAGLGATALVLAACGGGGEATAPSGSPGSSGSPGGEVEVFTWWTEGGEKAGLDALVQVFEDQNPGFTFVNGAVAGGAGSNAKNVLASRLQSGEPPATFQAHAGEELADYIAAGQIEPVTDLYEQEGWNEAFPADLLELLTSEGDIYSVPANIHRANVVWANPNVLSDAGITAAPASMDAWIEDLGTLQANGMDKPLAVATDWTQVHLLETVLIADLGAESYIGLWDGTTDWASAEVTAALEDYQTLLSFANTNRAGLDWPDATQYVIDGQAAYTVMGDWVAATLESQDLIMDQDWTWFPVPGTQNVFDFLADSFVRPVDTPNPAGTDAWLRTVGSPEGQKAFNLRKGSIPARTDANPADYPAYQQAAMADFASDTIVPSLAHGAAAPVGWLTEITSAVGQFGTNPDVATLQGQLVAAAQSHTQG